MKLSTLLLINAVVAAVFGVLFVLVPGPVLALYGVTPDQVSTYLAQIYGAELVGYAVLTYLARNAAASPLRNALVLSLFVGDAIGFVASLLAQLKGFANGLGWSSVLIYLLLAVGFGYAYFAQGRQTLPAGAKA